MLLTVIVIVFLFIGVYLYYFQFGGLKQLIQSQVSKAIKDQKDISFTLGDIKGNFVSEFELNELSVFYDDSLNFYRVLYFPKLKAAYSISNIWNERYIFDYLYIDSARIELKKDSTGQLLIPKIKPKSQQPSKELLLPLLAVNDLKINNLNFSIVERNDTAIFKDINLEASFEGSEETYSMEVNRFDFLSSQEAYKLDNAHGKFTYHKNQIVFQDLSVSSEQTKIKLDGSLLIDEKLSGSIEFVVDDLNLTKTTANLKPKLKGLIDANGTVKFGSDGISGNIFLAGDLFMLSFQNLYADFNFSNRLLNFDTLYGTIFEGCTIDGNGFMDFNPNPGIYFLSAEVNDFDLNNIVSKAFHTNLSGYVEMDGYGFKEKDLRLGFRTELYESSLREYPLQNASGEIIVTIDSITFNDFFRVDYFENRFFVNGKIDYDDSLSLNVIANLDNLDRYKGKLFIDQPGGRGYSEATLTGLTMEPDLSGFFISDSVWLYDYFSDSLYSEFKIDRFLTGKQGEVTVTGINGFAWDIPYDSSYVKLSLDSNLVYIDSAVIENEFSKLRGKGLLDYGSNPYQVQFDSLVFNIFDHEFVNDSLILFDVDSAGFDFKNTKLIDDQSSFAAKGRVNYDETMNLKIFINQINVSPWVKLFSNIQMGGILSCDGLIDGNFLHPEIHVDGSIKDLKYRDLILGDLVTSLDYSDKLLSIDSVKVYANPGEYYGTGYIPLNLTFSMTSFDRLPDAPIDFRMKAKDNRFDLVSLILPSVEQLDGDFLSNLHLTGTIEQPHLMGDASLINGRLKYFDLEHPIYVDSAHIRMEDNKVHIDGIEIYSTENKERDGKRRYAEIEGEMTVKTFNNFNYDVDVEIKNDFPFSYELDDISGKIEGNLHIQGDTPPTVSGDLTLLSTKYMVNFAEPDQGSPIMLALSGGDTWDLDINIDILSNYWIKNEDIDAEFSGQVKLIREDGLYRFIGEMEILRGRGYLFDKTFRLDQGGLVIFEGERRFNPRLDIVGHTRIPGLSQGAFEEQETSEMIELGVHITGTLDTVEISSIDGSNFSNEDIIPMIVGNYYASDSISTSGQLENRLTGLLSTQVSQIGTRQLNQLGIGVETFEIEPYYGQENNPLATRITVGFYTTPGLYVYGKSPLSGQSGQEVGFEYRFNKSFLVEGRRDEEQLYHLNLKLHLEFAW
ncbi:MAG: translocation/assembly module TamB domain-containing protein [candidate division Zixibacteria bacterium]|nr:translocation/assembly module TamB domain-containing protein [candidate division Zixibacteria bacterium]